MYDTNYYNSLIAPWRIVREIGHGGFGTVYEIARTDPVGAHEYRAALKVIHIPQDANEAYNLGMSDVQSIRKYYSEGVKGILDECALMSQFKGNSNIVSYEDHQVVERTDEIGWDILIRMELLKPISAIAQTLLNNENNIIRLGCDMCRALELCGRKSILHRDIKPANIFVSEMGDFKLGDFGISRALENTTGASTRTGTPLYMAPEVYRGERYGAEADIYSLGLVLYAYLNNGRLPFMPENFTRQDFDDVRMKRMRGDAIPRPANGSDALAAVVLKACSFNPADRYADAAQMRAALKAAMNDTQPKPQPDPIIPENQTIAADAPKNDRTISENKTVAADIPKPDHIISGNKTVAADIPKPDHTISGNKTAAVDIPKPQPEFVPKKKKKRYIFKIILIIMLLNIIYNLVNQLIAENRQNNQNNNVTQTSQNHQSNNVSQTSRNWRSNVMKAGGLGEIMGEDWADNVIEVTFLDSLDKIDSNAIDISEKKTARLCYGI